MTDIDRIEVEVLTGDDPDASTNALVYLGLGGREFLLDNRDEDDFRRGDRNIFRLGRGSTVTSSSANDPSSPQLTLDDLGRYPVYLRINARVDSDAWLLDNVWVTVRTDHRDIRYGRTALDGSGRDCTIRLGIRNGCVLHLEAER